MKLLKELLSQRKNKNKNESMKLNLSYTLSKIIYNLLGWALHKVKKGANRR